jgi:hypothetical protein
MAGATITRTVTGMPDSDVAALRLEYNKLVDDHDALVAKVNAIITAAATNVAAIAAVTAQPVATAAKIASSTGSTTV